jgi:Flp pilus assembly protein TadD
VRPVTAGAPARSGVPPGDSLETFMGKVRAQSEKVRPKSAAAQTVEAGDPDLARALVALAARPSPERHRTAAERYLRLGILDSAHEHFSAAVALDAKDAAAWDGLARIWRDWGFPHLALSDAHRAVYFAPESPVTHNTLATVLQALGRRADARTHYERALALDSTAVYALSNLCYGWILEGEPTKAAAACREALRLQPGLQPARNNLALAYEAAGDLPAALDVFASSDLKGRAEYNAGVVHLARRRYGEALKAFEAAQRLRPQFRAAEAMARQARRQLTQGSEP